MEGLRLTMSLSPGALPMNRLRTACPSQWPVYSLIPKRRGVTTTIPDKELAGNWLTSQ